jgi:hypothetical protein
MPRYRWRGAVANTRHEPGGPDRLMCFAALQSDRPVRLVLHLLANPPGGDLPELSCSPAGPYRPDLAAAVPTGFRYVLVVPPPTGEPADDQVLLDLAGPAGSDVPPCRVILRRSTCTIRKALLDRGPRLPDLLPQTEAALLWYGWRRCRELVGMKRFSGGRSGSDVLVFRPRLRAPDTADRPLLSSSAPSDVLDATWGSWLLVKTGPAEDTDQEWQRFEVFVKDRVNPFLARSEAYLPVQAVSEPDGEEQATLVSSFLGGDVIRAESLEDVIRSTRDVERCKRLLDRTFSTLALWHAGGRTRDLGEWRRVYRGPADDWLLFGKFDLAFANEAEARARGRLRDGTRAALGREEFVCGLRWDNAFLRAEHLRKQLLGQKDGLLYRLREIPARYSMAHGDLNPRNVLCDGDNIWLIDFEHAGVAPSLVDYARLEANLRLFCLTLTPTGENAAEVGEALERHLLAHFHGSEGGLGPVRAWADGLGAERDELVKLAHCVAHVRLRAAGCCSEEFADRRDYLAVLYLTVLSLLQYAGEELAPAANYHLLVSLAWVLEEALCRIVGMPKRFERTQTALDPARLLTAAWLEAPGAPGRVCYLMERPDGRAALPALAATRGVLQSTHHHLDVFDHTLLVLAYVEALLEDPLAGFLDPGGLDRQVAEALRQQGVRLAPIPASGANPAALATAFVASLGTDLGPFLRGVLTPENRQLLKWCALLHDVGKPGTRCLTTAETEDGAGQKAKVQFLGHPEYGLELLRPALRHLFPEARLRQRLEGLIRQHHRHHDILKHYTERGDAKPGEATAWQALLGGLPAGQVPGGEYEFLCRNQPADGDDLPNLPLLILHGFADSLACRGLDNQATLTRTAEIDLAVLAFCARYKEVRDEVARLRQDEQAAKQKHTDKRRRVSEQLRQEKGHSEEEWKPIWNRIMHRLGAELRTNPHLPADDLLVLARKAYEKIQGAPQP